MKHRITYIIISAIMILGLGFGIFFSFSCLETENQSGTTVKNLGGTPSGVTDIEVTKLTPQVEGKKAAIKTDSSYTEYDTIKEAYEDINYSAMREFDTTLIFFDDWIAEGDEGFGQCETSKYGNYIYNEAGALTPYYRDTKLTIDLNGYTLGRKLDNPVDGGFIICIGDNMDITIKNGYITGGKNTGCGGAIYVEFLYGGGEIHLTNLHITNNYAGENGGGIYTGYLKFNSAYQDYETNLYLNDCSIYNNTAASMGGGIFQDIMEYPCYKVSIKLVNKVIIFGNTATANKDHNNYTLRGYDRYLNLINDVSKIGEGSSVYVSFSNDQKDSDITNEYEDKAILENALKYLHSDDSDRNLNLKQYENIYKIIVVEKSGC